MLTSGIKVLNVFEYVLFELEYKILLKRKTFKSRKNHEISEVKKKLIFKCKLMKLRTFTDVLSGLKHYIFEKK